MKRASKPDNKNDFPYNQDRKAAASNTMGDASSERNNNSNAPGPSGNEAELEKENKTGPVAADVTRKNRSKFRSNRSMDA